MDEKKYYNLSGILKFLGFDYQFERKSDYPFNRNPENIEFSWGQILIPKKGIKEMVQNKISDINERPLKELVMMYQIPFIEKSKNDTSYHTGVINQDITLSFRYDKEYKYGDINKSIYECCFYILENAARTNDFFIISDDVLFDFFSYYIIDNQWGIGRITVSSPPQEKYKVGENNEQMD